MLIYSYRLRYGLGEPSTSYSCKRAGPAESLRNPDAGPRIRQDLSSGARRARLRWRLFHGLEHYSRCATAAVMFKFRAEESQAFEQGVFRKRMTSAEEQSCAELPDSIKLRDLSSPKVAALSSLVAMPYLVSSPALARHPSARVLIIRHPRSPCCS